MEESRDIKKEPLALNQCLIFPQERFILGFAKKEEGLCEIQSYDYSKTCWLAIS